MKKLLLIILIIFMRCAKDTTLRDEIIIDSIENDLYCNCVQKLYQVSAIGNHIFQGQSNVTILCLDDGKIFNKVYSNDGTRLLMYKIYDCN